MTEITTVVLDLGNVLIGWDPRRAWAPTRSEEEIAEFLEESGFTDLNRSLDGGRRYADARAELELRHPHHVPTLDEYWEAFADTLTGPVPGMHELVAQLHAGGTRLLGLTNWSAETYHHAPAAVPAIALLEDVLVSGRVGLAKPDPAIFELLIGRYRLVPEQTMFVDDAEANVVAARSAGLIAHRFVDAERLRADLEDRGVPLGS
jgi:2-haloacid dehalogenase